MLRKVFLMTVLMMLQMSSVYAGELILNNGDRVTGEVLHKNSDSYVVKTEAMGIISILQTHVKEIIGSELEAAKVPVNEKPAKAEKSEKKKIWSGSVDLGADLQKGNKETVELKSGFKVKRKTEKNEFDVKGNAYYSAEDKKMNAQKYDGMIRYAYSFGKELKWYNFYKLEVDHDRFANIDYRLVPTTGVGYWFYDTDDFKAMTEIGVGVEYTAYREGQESTAEGILVPRLYIEKRLLGESRVSEDLTIYPSFTESGEYRLKSETVLTAPIAENVSLKFTLLDEYNSKPGGGAKKNDLRLTSGLSYNF